MSDRIEKQHDGSWAHRSGNDARNQQFNNLNPMGANPHSGQASVIFRRRQNQMSSKEVEVKRLPAGATIHFTDSDGYHRVGTVTKTMPGLGYSVLPSTGKRTIVTLDRIMH